MVFVPYWRNSLMLLGCLLCGMAVVAIAYWATVFIGRLLGGEGVDYFVAAVIVWALGAIVAAGFMEYDPDGDGHDGGNY